jgi:hypothetical protein
MDKEQVREGYQAAIDDGYTHTAVAKATGLGVSSLKNFYHDEGGFSSESAQILEAWLTPRGFMAEAWARRDPFDGVCAALRGIANEIEAESSLDARRATLRDFATRLLRHPAIAGFENPGQTREK